MTTSTSLTAGTRLAMTADSVNMRRIKDGLFAPVLGPLLQNRWIIALLVAASFVQIALAATGITAWQCPVRSTLGVDCPGCGLTRAAVLLIQGHWQASFDLHAFASIFLGIGIFLAIGSILPARLQQMVAYQTANLERHTGIVALIGFGFILYWITRVLNLI
ncbi:MAG: DUF2752 domain-containing protein [Desulfobacterales bacterium]